ncbi:MAG: cytochrome c3 family protein [Verrucomicrobiota bacterium]|nr:hypothetical protein [Limisphaera sp.]MDW8381283.1 cytochrome c3 family protein [Verrucomicrobiota bacterium]
MSGRGRGEGHVRVSLLASLGLCGALPLMWLACSTVHQPALQPPHIEGAHLVGNRACYDCHTNLVRIFPTSPHARLPLRTPETHDAAGCEACHGPGSLHVAAGGGRGRFILNPSRQPQICLDCHWEVHDEFRLPSRHPVLEGRMTCSQCHDPHGIDITKPAGGLVWARLNETCGACHAEQVRPRLFEHEALREGCTVCHVPHGSTHAALLTERDSHLCLKCHAQTPGPGVDSGRIFIGQVDHTERLRMGTCWSAGCHTAVHGSDVHARLLY